MLARCRKANAENIAPTAPRMKRRAPPAFAVVLTWVAATGAGLMGFVYLFVFSLGMTVLLVAVGLSAGTLALLPRSGTWMIWAKRLAAIAMLAMAEYYFVRAGYNL